MDGIVEPAAAPSRRAARLGLGAAIFLLLACVMLILGAGAFADHDLPTSAAITNVKTAPAAH